MNNPFVSVIVPNYNHAKFLEERLNTILSQTYQNFELIILDDASTDNSLMIIDKIKDNPHISHIIINKENCGSPFRQWHKGFQLAKGDLIWIAESDDSCSPFFLERLVEYHCVENAVFTFCRSLELGDDGKFSLTRQNELQDNCVWEGKDFIKSYLGRYCIVVNASSVVFNKEAVAAVPLHYLDYKGAGDWLFWIELSRQGKVAFCKEPLNYFRCHDSSTTRRCLADGTNSRERKKINEYLYKEGLISKTIYRNNIRMSINRLKYSSNVLKDTLLKDWGANRMDYKIKSFMSKILNKMDSIIWK
jgi:glycosyltransferase involved in cell wall biosynthesis